MRRFSGQCAELGHVIIALACCATALTTGAAHAAAFAAISGSLSIRAGSHAPQSTPAVVGAANLFDSDFPAAVASASFVGSIHHASQFEYSATASSSSNSATTVLPPSATAVTSFEQSFTTDGQQWIEVSANVLSPADPGVSASVTFGRAGQSPLYIFPDTTGATRVRAELFAAGNYSISGYVNTQATVAPAHAGAVSGHVLIAALGDFNGNQVVDAADFNALKANFGAKIGTFASGNLDGDADTDGADFLLVQRQLGTHFLVTSKSTAIPEPSTFALASLIACGLAARARLHCRTNRSAARRAAMSPAR